MSSLASIALRIGWIFILVYLGLVVLVALFQRHLIYQPDGGTTDALRILATGRQFEPWTNAFGTRIGWFRSSPHGSAIGSVLILHGNAGSAVDRDYLADPLQQALPLDVYILEYPGYGDRTGVPSQSSLLAAADEAGDLLIGRGPLYLVGESLGTGPTAHLAGRLGERVAGVLFFAPYPRLAAVAGTHYPWLPVRWMLRDPYPAEQWLAAYPGPVGVVLAGRDEIIPPRWGRVLYDSFPGRKQLWEFADAGHNEVVSQPPEWWMQVGRFWALPGLTRGDPEVP